MLLINEREVARLLPPSDVLAATRAAFLAQAQGKISMPLRTLAAQAGGVLGAMPAAIFGDAPALGAKLVTVFGGNAASGIPTHNALIAMFDVQTGRPAAVMDGRYITEVRTAAASALATSLLARADARTLAILGTGVQAHAHIEALAAVMRIDDLRIWGRTEDHARQVAEFARGHGLAARIMNTPAQACLGAMVICTVTSSREPILGAADVSGGAHINAVGFGGPSSRELSAELVRRARIFVDSADGAKYESGNLILARQDGDSPADSNLTLLCDVLAGRAQGRQSQDEITLFDSLGIAIEDLACAQLVFERARQSNIGIAVDL